MQRPDFDSIKSYSEFEKYYWYRDELIKICKAHGLKAPSGKIELLKVIEAYFAGEIIPQEKTRRRNVTSAAKDVSNTDKKENKSAKNVDKSTRKVSKSAKKANNSAKKELTLATGLIECGFTFGNRFREFFSQQTGEEKFKFNVDMVATAKAVKESKDESFTLGDLLDIYYGKKEYAKYDKSELRWNKFVKDFCADEATGIYKERLKAAATLWKIVRDSDMKKEYSHELFEKYKDEIAQEKVLYVTDLDGTLLNKQDTISPFSIRTINDLVEKGMTFTYATARSLVSASKVTKGLSTNIPVIAYNGAFIFRPNTGEILSKEDFNEEERSKVKKILSEHNISPMVYSFIDGVEKVSWIPKFENDGVRRYLSNRKGDKRFRAVEDNEALYEGEVFYYTCIGEKEELQPIYEIFSRDDRYRCTMQQELYRPEYWCEIMPAKASKANAIAKLKELWGCSKVISFGDAINDIPMFEISDECYAVENAVDELKAVATGIVESNEDDGVAKWLSSRFSKL